MPPEPITTEDALRAAQIAGVLVKAALANRYVQEYIRDLQPWHKCHGLWTAGRTPRPGSPAGRWTAGSRASTTRPAAAPGGPRLHAVEVVYRVGSFVLPADSEEERWLIAEINDFVRSLAAEPR